MQQKQCYHYVGTSQYELEHKLLETSHFAVTASQKGFKVTTGELSTEQSKYVCLYVHVGMCAAVSCSEKEGFSELTFETVQRPGGCSADRGL